MKREVNAFDGADPVHVIRVIHLILGDHDIRQVRVNRLMRAFLSSDMAGSKLAAHPLA